MKSIPMIDLKLEYEYMKMDIDAAVKRCLEHQKWILGPEVKEFEDTISKYLSVKHCVGVSSGTDALVLSLRAMAIKLKEQEYFDKDDEIITTPFTFTATGDAILRSGATPVFVDIDPDTYNIDPERIKEYLTSPESSKVVGILPVHLYGQPCHMDGIQEIASKRNLFILEDVAQAFGGRWKGGKLGSLGTAGAFSFFPSKNLGAFGDGGMVATDDNELAELVRMLLRHGGRDKYNVDHIGYNARLDTLQAAILLAKMKYLDEFNEKRRQIAEIYNEEFKDLNGLILPSVIQSLLTADSYHVYHQYTIRVLKGKRDDLLQNLKNRGVNSMVYYPVPLHKMKVFDGRKKTSKDLLNSEQAASEVLSLPMEPLLGKDGVMRVVDTIRNYYKS